MYNRQFIALLRFAAISGNILFVLWLTYNAVNEHFSGTLVELVSYATLMGLLIVNCFLILVKRPNGAQNN